MEGEDTHRHLGVLGLLAIAFFWVCGGVYGNELLLEAAPPGILFPVLIGAALLYACPAAVMIGELATGFPYDGGIIQWVEETCGRRVSAQNTYWTWVGFITASAVYPGLMAEYIDLYIDLEKHLGTSGVNWCCVIQVWIVTVVKLGGTDVFVNWSTTMGVVAVLPTIVFMGYGVTVAKPATWISTDESPEAGGMNQSLLISWVIWLYSGFFDIGTLAGEVKNPARSYKIALVVLIPVTLIFALWPLAVSVSMDSDRNNYGNGYFEELASRLAGKWLGYGYLIGAIASFFGLLASSLVVCERTLSAFVNPRNKSADTSLNAATANSSAYVGRNRLVRYLLIENGTGVAPVYIIANALVVSVLVWLSPANLVECSIITGTLPFLLTCYAFVYYKIYHPDVPRPFKVPGGVAAGVCLVVPIIVFLLAYLYIAFSDATAIFGIPFGKLVFFGVVVVGGALGDVVVRLRQRCGEAAIDPEDTTSGDHIRGTETQPLLQK
eukprot:m.557236 g.557236  ORF g.557236 m.557236 type:complete len:494 (-) comp22189_c2_seq19:333-1814(-)